MIASDPEKKGGVRKLATEILRKVDTRKAYADILLDHALRDGTLPVRDRSLLTEIVYGTLRWRSRLDAYLKPLTRRLLEDTSPFIRNLLRLTVYQLVFLNKIPDYAAVNEAVELAKARAGGRAGGFVNGILRNFLREEKQLAKPDLKSSPIYAFAEYWSHPEWLVQKWLDYFGSDEIEALLQANNDEAPLVLRANRCKGKRETLLKLLRSENVEASPAPWAPEGIIIQSRLPVDQLPGFDEGWFQVQGEASQLVTRLLDPKPGERILDACAAPGGKTTHIAELMEDIGEVIATDISERGLKRVRDNAERLGMKSIRTFRVDFSHGLPDSLNLAYDRILADAPCSGLGTLRSHPEIKWNRSESDIERLSRLQKKIMARAASYLKPGGVLVYSTCTLTEDENEKVAEDFLEQHKEFVLEDAAGYLPEQAKHLVRGSYFLALPHRHNTDGFFAARMRKVI